jgi:DNA-binding NarL/FixJ family response regulator
MGGNHEFRGCSTVRHQFLRVSHKAPVSARPSIINVIVADHQPVFRAGIAKLLAAEDDMRIIAQPLSPEHLLNAVERLRPHVLVLSSGFFPDPEQVRTITGIAGERQIAILVLTDNAESTPHFIPLGVQGVFYRSIKGEMLIEGVRRLAQGGRFLQMHAAAEISADLVGERVTSKLSSRELKIISAIAQGCRNSEIAKQMGTSVPLLKKMIRTIFDKTGVSGRLELALFVVHHQVLAHAAAEQHLDFPALPALTPQRRAKFSVAAAAASMSPSLPKTTTYLPHPPKSA